MIRRRVRKACNDLRCRINRLGEDAHRIEPLSHLAYFAAIVSHLDYRWAAALCLMAGIGSFLRGEVVE